MIDVFISHVEEDQDVALELSQGLEAAGFTTWCYRRLLEALNRKFLAEQPFCFRELVHRDDEIEIEADDRIGVGVDALPTDHAVPNAVSGEPSDEAVEEVRPVHRHRFPEFSRTHATAPPRLRTHGSTVRC